MLDSVSDVAIAENVDGIFLYTNGVHSIDRPSFVEYLTGVSPIADENALIVSRNGDATFLVDLPRDADRITRHSDINDVRGSTTFGSDLLGILDEHGIRESVGVVGIDRMPKPTYELVTGTVEKVQKVESELKSRVSEKSPGEIALFRKLGRIADQGFRAVIEHAEPGMKEYELSAEVEYEMRSAGADDNFNLFGSRSHNQLMHSPTDRILEEGDVVLCELSPMCDGLILQICRTVSIGTPDPTLTAKYDLLREALARTKERLAVGKPASIIAKTMNDVFRREGYDEYCKPPYMRTRGHEFGMGPLGMSIDEETETKLHENMILVVHPNQYVPETGYLALGDPVLLDEDGPETLVNTAPRLHTKEVI